ncbi:MAG: FaeA/PapI family transcriptional regulator, partial [Eubacteriales bacterium]|nr:FaeA/PapI family transcriptional regulator [Eubacteriales bacterium]
LNKTSEIKRAKKTLQNKEKIVTFLENNGASKTSEIANVLGLSETRTRALLKEMVSEGSLMTNGGTKKKIYFLQV